MHLKKDKRETITVRRTTAKCKECGIVRRTGLDTATWLEFGKKMHICRPCLKKKAEEQLAGH